jgi:hypothetical protein
MAEKDDQTDPKELTGEKTEKKDSEDDADMPDAGEEDREKDDNRLNGEKTPGSKKWILFSGIFLILVFVGVGIRWMPNLLPLKKDFPSDSMLTDMKDENLMEENLSPFFIPPSSGSSRGAIRIDLSAIWDGLTSIRFRKNELRTRSRMYDYMMEVAEKNEDLHSIIPVLEEEMGRIVQESLSVRGLAIRIKEIKYL